MNCGEISAIVLAAGASSRMGQNKLLMEYRGEPVIMACLKTVLSCGFRENILVISEQTLQALAVPPEFTTIVNPAPETGQGHSAALGTAAASKDTCGLIFFQADMPLLDKSTVQEITSGFDGTRIAVPFVAGEPRSPVIFPVSLMGELMGLKGGEGGRVLVKRHPELVGKIYRDDGAVFRDIDIMDDYKAINNV